MSYFFYINQNLNVYTNFHKTLLSVSNSYTPTDGQTEEYKGKGEHWQHVVAIEPEMI
jgi:hypothetical protein